MTYSTPAMVRKALVPSSDGTQPTTPSFTAADLDDAQLLDAIGEADSMIDSYLSSRYTTPVAGNPTPHPVDFWSRNIAAYNATLSYRESQDFPDTDPVARRYNATMEALKAVASGNASLPLPVNTVPDQGGKAGASAPLNPYMGDLFTPDDFSLRTGSDNDRGWPWPGSRRDRGW